MTQKLSALLFAKIDDERRVRILDGAMGCFLAYGYQRTTMDDIARAAEISRPALYLQFRNKADIYRALASAFMEHALENAVSAFQAAGDLETRLRSGLSCVMDLVGAVEASPHGADILDMKSSLAADIVASGRAKMRATIEGAIAASGATACSARVCAEMLLDAMDGMKQRMPPSAEQAKLKDDYIAVLMAALARPS
ncbi:TetR family transcriptional regulator [Aliihoeflea aestuarii]|jgi:AcrR family transcriptional regulator|uniref:TetR/AcrR family transcriptional regulator n=1 Tax=Aliihoeflea aestuarii TaxID=453840 RepID=UPI002093D6A8|nr:TetR/AcrR family transcriptional regulator [Aliihoeflea aestuarii]MCO6391224.1 TetR family transcriptional regulator [Aliihoeflea aestuarii]